MTRTRPTPTARDAARALRAIPSDIRSEASRQNGRKGGRPVAPRITISNTAGGDEHTYRCRLDGRDIVIPDAAILHWRRLGSHIGQAVGSTPAVQAAWDAWEASWLDGEQDGSQEEE